MGWLTRLSSGRVVQFDASHDEEGRHFVSYRLLDSEPLWPDELREIAQEIQSIGAEAKT